MRSRAEAAPSLLYLPELATLAAECALEGDEAHYLARVVRARAGEQVHATDGLGLRVTFEVIESRPTVRLRRLSQEQVPRTRSLVLGVGAPEGERADWLIEKLAELGASEFIPVECERADWKAWRADRMERLATAGLRQSLGAHRLRLSEPVAFSDWLSGLSPELARFEAAPGGAAVAGVAAPATGACCVLVGPSSGFSPGERKALSDIGFRSIALAASRLRTETAAIAAAAWWASGDPRLG